MYQHVIKMSVYARMMRLASKARAKGNTVVAAESVAPATCEIWRVWSPNTL